MSIFKEYRDYDGIGLVKLIKSKQISPLDPLDSAIDLIERLDPKLNCVHRKLYHDATESHTVQEAASALRASSPSTSAR